MASPKTRRTSVSVDAFLDTVADAQRRQDARDIVGILETATGAKANPVDNLRVLQQPANIVATTLARDGTRLCGSVAPRQGVARSARRVPRP